MEQSRLRYVKLVESASKQIVKKVEGGQRESAHHEEANSTLGTRPWRMTEIDSVVPAASAAATRRVIHVIAILFSRDLLMGGQYEDGLKELLVYIFCFEYPSIYLMNLLQTS